MANDANRRVYVPYNVAANHLEISDVLSYRQAWSTNPLLWPGLLCGRMIQVAGRGEEVHTGMADKDTSGEWLALGMRLGRQKLKFLEDEVASNPGLIDVWRYVGFGVWRGNLPCHASSLRWDVRRAICDEMRRFALSDHYGSLAVLRSSVYFLPFLRWVAPTHDEINSDQANARPYCSQAVSHSIRKHARRPLLNKRPDRHMLPGDVVTSPLLLYLFTLASPDDTPAPIEHYYERAEA